ncbi:hypothetical protein NTHiID11_00680 [Haemophilus influenzae]|nr:hypothetical protein CGSHiEE_09145 [Haemophilus influenzae PittEE]BBE90779.1 hypothetical protein CHBNII6_03860 [Haemophilus influenzae]BBE99629.1 hypothetical protein CHBNIII3_03950 [Haemophilus influenzae]GBK79787.1 hypothetical protein NTHiID11_00680 [Haemophilus influenzae]GBK94707.1 hypothetical protein NTHiID21_09370 [Haemophilus influenzae]
MLRNNLTLERFRVETSYELLNRVVQSKIVILKEEAHHSDKEQKATVLLHYTKRTVDKSMKRIIAENLDYHIIYRCEINAVILHIKVK